MVLWSQLEARVGRNPNPVARPPGFGVRGSLRLQSDIFGCRFITLDAYPKSIDWYKKNGFVFNKHYAAPEKTHPSMGFDIVKGTMIS